MKEPKLENFIEAFHSHSGGSVRECNCGRVFYNSSGGWDWENGELEKLQASKTATDLEWSVSTVVFEGKECVIDCDCWEKRAEQIMRFLDGHAVQICDYFKAEKRRMTKAADEFPTAEAS